MLQAEDDGEREGGHLKELPSRWRDLGEFIREQRAMSRLSIRRLSELAGVSNPYLSQIERGLRKPSADILQQIAKALRISAESLYVRAGILEERDDENDGDLMDRILRDTSITASQKQALISIYQSFRHENRSSHAHEASEHKASAGESDLDDGKVARATAS